MAQKYISPAIFISETDLSYLPQGISEIGAAIIGPTTKGPAFIPTDVGSTNEYYKIFGYGDGYSYIPYTVKEYLKNASIATIIRVLGIDGYTHNSVAHLLMSGSYGTKVVGVFHRSTAVTSQDEDDTLASSTVTPGASGSFLLHLEAETLTDSTNYSASLDSSTSNFVGNIVKTTPVTTDVGYAYQMYKNNISTYYTADTNSVVSMQFTNLIMTQDYAEAATPWITSQTIGSAVTNLFRFKTISHGNYVNSEIKIGVDTIKLGSEVPGTNYGTFTVIVREVDDNDRQINILEQFTNLNLDPTSPQYITRVIGDKVKSYSNGNILSIGDFENNSDYITVEVTTDVKNASNDAQMIPWGFRSVKQPVVVPSGSAMPSASFVTSQEYSSEYNTKIYYGFNFDFDTTDNQQYLMPLQENVVAGGNLDFNLDNYTVHADASTDAGVNIIDASVISARKFMVPFQGGFDGIDPATTKNMGDDITATNSMGYNFNSSTTNGSIAYNRAFNLLSNTDIYDFNLLVTPGIINSLHSYPCSQGIQLCEDRGDTFYIIDANTLSATVTTATNSTSTLDTNYAATYYPWVKMLDVERNIFVWMPPSVAILGSYAYNDRVAEPWYAPAGLNRGNLTTVTEAYTLLSQPNRDDLYENRVNPIATFPKEGITTWGQKTLQVRASALDRINVRRLLIDVKKFIASVGKYVVFEQGTRKTRNQLYNQINPYLENIQQKQGLYAFRVVLDETTTTDELIDRHIMKGELYLQPTKSVEYLQINLNIMPSGASFGE